MGRGVQSSESWILRPPFSDVRTFKMAFGFVFMSPAPFRHAWKAITMPPTKWPNPSQFVRNSGDHAIRVANRYLFGEPPD